MTPNFFIWFYVTVGFVGIILRLWELGTAAFPRKPESRKAYAASTALCLAMVTWAALILWRAQ